MADDFNIPKRPLFVGPSNFSVQPAPHDPKLVAVALGFSERDWILLKRPDIDALALLLSPDEAIRLAAKLLETSLSVKDG